MKRNNAMAKAKKLPSGNWRIQIYCGKDKNGKRIMKSFTSETKTKAQTAAEKYLRDNTPGISGTMNYPGAEPSTIFRDCGTSVP